MPVSRSKKTTSSRRSTSAGSEKRRGRAVAAGDAAGATAPNARGSSADKGAASGKASAAKSAAERSRGKTAKPARGDGERGAVVGARAVDAGAVAVRVEDATALEFLPARPMSAVRSGPRRAVFIDVENTSSEIDLVRVLEDLHIDRATTEVTAVGNWRVVGQQLGRMLAQRGAHLVHSAPAPRVPDWSDLWIAVTAGMWLGRAAPGDAIDILSDDRAFDAVGDAAARLGVAFRRITYRTGAGAAERSAASVPDTPAAGGRRRRRRRGGTGAARGERSHGHAARAHAPAHAAAAMPVPAAASADEERHAASQDQIRAVIARLTAADPVRGVSLDTLTLALKAEGFQRPPGSPRLVTRLRRIKDVELLPNGRVCLIGATAEVVSAAFEGSYEPPAAAASEIAADDAATGESEDGAEGEQAAAAAPAAAGKRRSRRRGGRGRRGGRRRAGGAGSPDSSS